MRLDPREREVLDRASYFVLSRRVGVGRYLKRQAPTLDAALELGRSLGGRWLVYAVAHPDHDHSRPFSQALVEVVR